MVTVQAVEELPDAAHFFCASTWREGATSGVGMLAADGLGLDAASAGMALAAADGGSAGLLGTSGGGVRDWLSRPTGGSRAAASGETALAGCIGWLAGGRSSGEAAGKRGDLLPGGSRPSFSRGAFKGCAGGRGGSGRVGAVRLYGPV